MSVLTIITAPHITLRTKAAEINPKKIPELKAFIRDLKETMIKKDGLGLAANQVNVLKRIIAVNTKDGPMAIVNPKLAVKSFKKEDGEEGCLSLPDSFGIVRRHQKVTVTGYDENGAPIKIKAAGMFARVLQHEIDHLEGVLFTDRAKQMTKGAKPDEPDLL